MSDAQGEIDVAEFRDAGHRLIEWIAEYLQHPESHPVLATTAPGSIAGALPTSAPPTPESLQHILDDFERVIIPGVTHWNHPGFLAYFANTGSVPGILAELATAALNVNAMMWRTSPVATELEQVTVSWLAQALALPTTWFGIITDTASMSTLYALAAAREHALPEARDHGLAGAPTLRVYCSREAHSSVDKAAIALGIGLHNVVRVPTDAQLRLDSRRLRELILSDRAAGLRPLAVVATVGTTSTTSVDPVVAIADTCRDHGLWLHVDAAYGGAAAIAPELRWVLEGASRADSLVVNPHKWLLTPMDISVLYTSRPEILRRAFSVVPEYLKSDDETVVNYMDYGVQLGRRFRALKLWMVLRAYGTEGIASRIREHVRIARELAERVSQHPDLELMAPAPLSVVCLRACPREFRGREHEPEVATKVDRLNQAVLDRVNAAGEFFLSHTRLAGKFTIRVAIGNIRTTEAHVRRLEQQLLEAARVCAEEL